MLWSLVLARLHSDHTGICSVVLVTCNCTDSAESGVRGWTRLVSFLDFGVLNFVRERDSRLNRVVCWLVFAWAWVKVRIRDSKIASDVRANPVSNVLLVHRVLIDLVLSWAWHVQVLSASLCLHSEAELWNLAESLVRLRWVSKIKVSGNVVVSRSRSSRILVVNP